MDFPGTDFSGSDFDKPWVFSDAGAFDPKPTAAVSGGTATITWPTGAIGPDARIFGGRMNLRKLRAHTSSGGGRKPWYYFVTEAQAGTPCIKVGAADQCVPLIASPGSLNWDSIVRISSGGTTYGLQVSLQQGDFDIYTKITWTGDASITLRGMAISLYPVATDYGEDAPNSVVLVRWVGNGSGTIYLRAIRSGTTLTLQYSSDGSSWTSDGTATMANDLYGLTLEDVLLASPSLSAPVTSDWDFIKAYP